MDKDTKLIITPTSVGIEGSPLNIFEMIQLTMSAMLSFMNQTLKGAPKKAREYIKAEIYEYVNAACSNTLNAFAPEYDLHPDITTEALMRMEDQILQEKIAALSPEERQKADSKVINMKEFFENKVRQDRMQRLAMDMCAAPDNEQEEPKQ